MRKLFLVAFAFVLISLSVSFVLGADIAYVVKNTALPDNNLVNIINEAGYDYKLIDDSDVSSTDFSNYEMILIGNQRINNVPVNDYRSLVINTNYYEDWSSGIGSTSSSSPLSVYNIGGHEIIKGLEGGFQAYTQCCNDGVSISMYYLTGKKYCNKISITSYPSGLGDYAVAAKDNPKRVFFGITETDYWTQETKQLFKNSLKWLIREDKDGDGFYSDEDCNDENAEINPDAEELVDDVDQNCLNDAPVLVNEIENLSWNRGETKQINLNNYFSDPDGDELTFSVDSTSEDENIIFYIEGDLVSLNGTENWTGEDWIIFKAEDLEGSKKLSNEVILTVLPTQCQEAGGYVCSENEVCLGGLFDVNDANVCCASACSPKFKEVDRCESLNAKIKIAIEKPEENEEFKIGKTINVRLKFENTGEEDFNFDVEVYFYDITDNDIIETDEDSIDISKGDKKVLSFEFEIPEDLDEENNYAVFAKIIEEDGKYCNEDYAKINIKKEEHEVIIEDIQIEKSVECGNYIYVKTKVRNLGSNDEKVYIMIENSDLGINEQTEKFDLEKSGEKNEISKTLEIKISDGVDAGGYEIKVSAVFDGKRNFVTKNLAVECEKIETETFNLGGASLDNSKGEIKEPYNKKTIIFLVAMSAILIICLFGFYVSNNLNGKGKKILKNFKLKNKKALMTLKKFKLKNKTAFKKLKLKNKKALTYLKNFKLNKKFFRKFKRNFLRKMRKFQS